MNYFSSTPDMQSYLRQQGGAMQGGYTPNVNQKPGNLGFGGQTPSMPSGNGQIVDPGFNVKWDSGRNAWDDPAQMAAAGNVSVNMGNPYMGGPAGARAGFGGQSGGSPFYQGPTSASAGELAGNYINQTMPSSMGEYGYGNRAGQGGGYYEQQTPVGSFAAANQQYSQGAKPVSAMYASNPYIGQTSAQAQGGGQVQAATAGNNPYIGQTTQGVNYQGAQGAGQNAYAGSNPYLTNAIQSNADDMTRSFSHTVQPQFDRMAQQSGSFGNAGVQQAQNDAYNDLNKQIGQMSNQMRMQDYTSQQGLAENALNRQQANNQFNAANQLGAGQFNSQLQANDLNRNLGATSQVGMFNAGQLNNMGQFNSSQGQQNNQFNANLGFGDLSRNANLASSLGQFNAGQGNNMGQFNAQLGQNNNQFNAGQGNAMNMFNTGQGNAMLTQARNLNQQESQFGRSFGEGQRQFNENLDRGIYNDNMGWADRAQNNQLNLLNSMYNWNNQGANLAGNIYNQPLNYYGQFANFGNAFGGQGGVQQQQMPGNPFLGGIAGANLGMGAWNAYQNGQGGNNYQNWVNSPFNDSSNFG